MATSINQRIRRIADKLCDGNISELARILNVKQSSLRDVVGTLEVKPRSDVLTNLANSTVLQINPDWLLTGRGSMQRDAINILHRSPYNDVGKGPIPIYDINAAANLHTLFLNDNQKTLGEIVIPNAPDCDGAIYVRGDSMDPILKNGDMVAYKKVNNIGNFMTGVMYLLDFHIEGDDFLVVKYVKWEEKPATLRLISYNKLHEDMVIPVSAVRSVALIKVVVGIRSMY